MEAYKNKHKAFRDIFKGGVINSFSPFSLLKATFIVKLVDARGGLNSCKISIA